MIYKYLFYYGENEKCLEIKAADEEVNSNIKEALIEGTRCLILPIGDREFFINLHLVRFVEKMAIPESEPEILETEELDA